MLQVDFASTRSDYEIRTVCESGRRQRLALLGLLSIIWGCFLVYRMYELQLGEQSRWRQSAMKQHVSEVKLALERGKIVDRNGQLLAVSVPAGSVYVRPAQVKNKEQAAQAIAEALGVHVVEVAKKLKSKSPFVWIKRQVPRVYAKKVADLGIDGAGYFLEAKRYYPLGASASTLLGLVGVDGKGLSGIEASHETLLGGESVRSMVHRDAFGKQIALRGSENVDPLPKGKEVFLTLDSRLQLITDEELEIGRQRANAKSATAVMIDSDTGEILALSQSPAVNFNSGKLRSRKDLTNLVVESVFEPGSILKPIVAAGAIDAGIVRPSRIFDCENGHYRFGRHTINDVHGSDELSVHDIVVRSSNIGMTKIGLQMGDALLYNTLKKFGFGETSGLKLPGETAGILRPVSRWAKVDVATHSYGQGVAVNGLQIVRAVSAIANGGVLPPLRLVEGKKFTPPVRVISEQTSQAVREMMYDVVESEHGTGKRAALKGVRIGGKTGTAQLAKTDGRGYEPGAYVASFVGFVDGASLGIPRKLTLLVSIKRPNTTSIYGGTLAGPVFQRIVQRTLLTLGASAVSTGKRVNGRAPASLLTPVSYTAGQ
jgi:cell division protein FtsI (penicillin-binding protein 3)